jgi:N-acetylglucosaminyl-diphospho-decaprenol L-rhamnosyltransferase
VAGLQQINRVIVVDNSGSLPDMAIPGATVLRPGRNLGFGAGANVAAREASTPLLLLTNPDARLAQRDFDVLVEALLSDDELAAVGPRLLNPDGSPQVNGGAWSGWAREVSRALGVGSLLRAVRAGVRREALRGPGRAALLRRDWLSAAVLLIRRAAFDDVGGFDEDFFLYYEDEDLCRRLRARGWHVGVCARASAEHEVGGSVTGDPYRTRSFQESRELYHRRHSGPLLRRFVRWDVRRRLSRPR